MTTTPLIGSAEAAKRLGVSRSTFQRMVTKGEIQPVFKGTGTYGGMTFREEDIPALIESRKATRRQGLEPDGDLA